MVPEEDKFLMFNEEKERKCYNNKRFYKTLKIISIYCFVFIILQATKYNKLLFDVNLNQKVSVKEENNIKIALCTMGKGENLYANEFVGYHLKLGIDHIFIYDDNDPNTEMIAEAIESKYKSKVTIYENIKERIKGQVDAFNECYQNNLLEYNWILMCDMDEFLFVVNDTLKSYLSQKIFDKCDFIKFHWAIAIDNDLVHYDPRSLFVRFKPPYIKDRFIKTIVRGNISDMKYWVHSPYMSPTRNVTCTNKGDVIIWNKLNFESYKNINVEKAFLIHFRYKSTEEFVNKYKRGFSNWHGNQIGKVLKDHIYNYFEENKMTMEKIKYIESQLNLTLIDLRIKYYFLGENI